MIDDRERPRILSEVIDSIAIIRFNRPTERNPLSSDTLRELQTELAAVTSRSDLSSIIFTGTDDVFASGANIRELTHLAPDSAKEFSEFGQHLFQSVASAPQVTIAAVNGYCMGGALDLALACDIRVASTTAVFAHPGARLGIITGWGGTQRLPRVISKTRGLELFLTARRFDAHEALEMGLITSIHDPVLDHAIAIAQQTSKARQLSTDFTD